jgi:hypothetical protein
MRTRRSNDNPLLCRMATYISAVRLRPDKPSKEVIAGSSSRARLLRAWRDELSRGGARSTSPNRHKMYCRNALRWLYFLRTVSRLRTILAVLRSYRFMLGAYVIARLVSRGPCVVSMW